MINLILQKELILVLADKENQFRFEFSDIADQDFLGFRLLD